MRNVLRLVLFLFTVCSFLCGDEKPLPWAEAQELVVRKVDPVYPPIAKTIALGGKVVIEVSVENSGSVASLKIISGHPMLTQAAIDAVKQWKFSQPDPVSRHLIVEITFDSGETKEQHEARLQYFPKADLCRELVNRREAIKGEVVCRESLSIAEKMHPNAVLERAGANTWIAHSLFLQQRFADALPFYEAAIRVGEGRLKEDDADLASDYANLGRVEFILGRTADARAHFERARSGFQKAIVALPSMKENYTARFKRILNEYAATERKLANPDKAVELEIQAANIK